MKPKHQRQKEAEERQSNYQALTIGGRMKIVQRRCKQKGGSAEMEMRKLQILARHTSLSSTKVLSEVPAAQKQWRKEKAVLKKARQQHKS